jgi:hypothetical protein
MAAIDAVQIRGAFGELAGELLLESGRGREFVEAPPVLGAGQSAFGRSGMVKYAFHR